MLAHMVWLAAASPCTIVLAVAFVAGLVAKRMAMAVTSPVARAARRAIIRTGRILRTAFRARVAIEDAAVTAGACTFAVAPVAASAGVALAVAARPRGILHRHRVTRVAVSLTASARSTRRVTTGL